MSSSPRARAMLLLAAAFLSAVCGERSTDEVDLASSIAPTTACAAFGEGIAQTSSCADDLKAGGKLPLSGRKHGKITWAVPMGDQGLALCDEELGQLVIWSKGDNTFTEVDLAPLAAPVGAIYSFGKVYVACFGGGKGKAGLAVVEGSQATAHPYPDGRHFVHNVYSFQRNGEWSIFAAVIGNPWANPPVLGDGLVRFDLEARDGSPNFVLDSQPARMHARSAVQQADHSIFVLTQEPPGHPTRLVRLEVEGDDRFVEKASTTLPARSGGDGGADVMLGMEHDTVFCTDRTAGNGKLYFYRYADGNFDLGATRDTGRHPRYSTIVPTEDDGDIVVCNRDDATLSVFKGLVGQPECTGKDLSVYTIPTVSQVSFFIQHAAVPAEVPQK